MEEEMIIKAFELFKTQGYTGTIEDFRSAIERDETLLEDSKNLVSSSLGKTNGVAEMDATVTPEPEASENMDLQSEDISLGLEEPEEYTYFGDLGKKIKAGTYRALATISEIPNYLNSFKGAIGREFMTDEERKRYDDLDPVVQDAINNIDGISFIPGVGNASMTALAMAGRKKYDEYKQKSDALYETLKTYETTIGQDIYNLDFAQATARTFSDAIGTLPSLVQAMIPGVGIASIALGSAAEASREAREVEGKETDLKTMGFSTIIGASEGLLEVVTKRIGGRMFKSLAGKNKNVIKKTLKDFVFNVSKEYGKEGASETATEIINTAAEAIYLDKEVDFDEKFAELVDVFLIGGAVGGGMGTTGGGAEIIRDITQGKRVKKELAKTDYNNLIDAYSDEKTTTGTIELSQNPNTQKFLNYELNQKVKDGDITQEQSDKIKLNFRETQGVVNSLKPLGLDLKIKSTPRLVELIKKQSQLEQTIKEVDNKALTKEETTELDSINKEISEVKKEIQDLAVESRTSKITKGADVVGKEVKTLKSLKGFDTQEQINEEISRLVDEGFIKEENKESISSRAGRNYGVILKNKETGEQRILINKTIAKEDGVMTTGLHEVSHAIVDRLISEDAQAETALGDGILKELQNNKNVTFINQQTGEAIPIEETNFYKRFLQYKEKYSDAEAFGEIIPLLSEALMPPLKGLNAEIQINETAAMKIGDIFRRLLQSVGINLNFNSGKDVLNFVRDYNRSVETEGKGKKAIRKISEKAKVSDKLKQGIETTKTKGETIVYNASPKSFDELGKRTGLIFLATDINEAKEYARNNGGDVKEIIVQNDALANEQQVLNKLKELNVDVSEGLLYEMIDPRFEDFYIGKQKVDQLKKELEKDGFKGFRYKDGSQLSNKGTESIAILDKSSIKLSERVLVTEADWNKANEEQRVELLLQAYKDPDDVDGLQFEEFKDLPDVATSNMYIDPEINEIRNSARFKEASDEVQRLFDEKPRDWEMKVIEEFRPITSKLVERRRGVQGFDRQLLMDEIETGKRGIYDLIQAYDPSKGVPLSAYIMSQLNNRMQEVSERNLEKYYTKDVTEERGVAATEDAISIEESVDESITPTAKEKLNLRKKIKLPDEQVEKVRQAVRKTFGTKLPPPDSPQFKKALRKAFDTELFKELKTNVFKARKDYEFFMSQNWKALYDAIPQETLNQSFAPFREPVLDETGKQRREKTPEGERIFRKKNITKEEFLDYFFSPDLGVSTRGTRKDAIVRMMAQELGFDAIMETIQEPKVAEKTKFVNPKITPQKIAPKVDRAIDEKFSLRKGVEFNKSNKFKTPDFQTQKGVEEYANHIKLLAEEGVFKNGLLTPSMLIPTVKLGTIKYVKNSKEAKIIENWIKRSNPTTKQIEQKDTDSPQRKKNSGIQQGEIKLKSYLRALIKDVDFGQKTIGTTQRADQVFGNTFEKFNEISSLPGFKQKVKEFNENNSKDFINFFMGIREILSNPEYSDLKNKVAGSLYFMLESSINQRNHPAARGAKFIGFYKGAKGKIKFEHAVPNAYAFTNLFEKALKLETDKEFEDYLKAIQKNYTLIALPEKLDKILNSKANSKFTMPNVNGIAWNPFQDFYWQRYLNNEIAKKVGKRFLFSNIEMIQGEENPFKTHDAKGFSETNIKASERKKSSFFAKMIEEKTGILAKQKVSAVRAAKMGEENRKIDYFIAPSAEDFMGLMYKLLGKGKLGDKQKEWVNKNIMRPYAIGIEKITTARNVVTNSFQTIKKDLNITEKDLKKKIPNSVFTQEDALRVYIWAKQGLKIPGLLKKEQKELVSYINGKSNLVKLANNIIKINNVDFKTPTISWQVGNLGTDMLESLNTTRRAEYLEEWQNNVDDIFSENNLNKLEAAFGKPYRLAVENSLQRMKTGRNRDVGRNNLVNRVVDWTNGATGAIMFFNTRSAILQLISAANFINFGDNNIVAAGKAFANQKQYWADVNMLFNSEFLVNRRDGLKMSVNEADIADVAREQGVRGLINKLLKLGFTPTQVADSIAIATGGATFYRNRYNALVKSGMNKAEANAQAMRDFRETAEESQQSSRPDKISQQQASELGRLILAFANTPSQYARIIKKAALDLKNRRGSDKENVSKILYYTFVQNLIFNALQNAMFAVAFGDVDDEDKLKKEIRVANGMADSLLRGMGIQGAILSIVKNAAIRIYKEEYGEIPMELFRISPPISSKVRKIERASNLMKWEGDNIFEQGLTLDNPAVEITGKTIEGLTNLPLDRVLKKITNLKDATDSELEFYQRLALTGGWSKWELGIQDNKTKTFSRKKNRRKKVVRKKVIRKKEQ